VQRYLPIGGHISKVDSCNYVKPQTVDYRDMLLGLIELQECSSDLMLVPLERFRI